MGGSFGFIIGSSDGGSNDDFWVFSTAWVSNRQRGFVDQWLGWWVWWPLLALTGLMVCVCVALLMVCVLCVWLCCGWVLAEVVGSSWFSMSFFFFF